MKSRPLSWSKLRWLLALVVAGVLPMVQAAGASRPVAAAGIPAGATLTILSGAVDIAVASGADFAPATQGQLVAPGAVVRTDSGSVALLTFFDGSESQVAPASQVEVRQADYTPSPHIELFQSQGVTVNRVIPLPPDGSFRTDTPDAIGLVRGTSYVVTVGNGTAAQRATSVVLLRDRDGHVGQVNVVPAITGLASEKPAVLARAGAVAVTADVSTASGKLSAAALANLEQSAHDLHDAGAAQTAATQAQAVLHTLAPVVQPLAAPVTDASSIPAASVDQVQHERLPEAASKQAAAQVTGATGAVASASGDGDTGAKAAASVGSSVSGSARSATATSSNSNANSGTSSNRGNGSADIGASAAVSTGNGQTNGSGQGSGSGSSSGSGTGNASANTSGSPASGGGTANGGSQTSGASNSNAAANSDTHTTSNANNSGGSNTNTTSNANTSGSNVANGNSTAAAGLGTAANANTSSNGNSGADGNSGANASNNTNISANASGSSNGGGSATTNASATSNGSSNSDGDTNTNGHGRNG